MAPACQCGPHGVDATSRVRAFPAEPRARRYRRRTMSTSSRPSRARTRSASAVLVALALVGGLAACGDDDGATATDPAGGGDATPIRVSGSAGVTDAVLVDATEGGGSPSTMAFALDTDQAVADFVTGMQAGLPAEVAAAVEDV